MSVIKHEEGGREGKELATVWPRGGNIKRIPPERVLCATTGARTCNGPDQKLNFWGTESHHHHDQHSCPVVTVADSVG